VNAALAQQTPAAWWRYMAERERHFALLAAARGDLEWQQHHSDCVARHLRIADEIEAKEKRP
jgi:hypothetical protein